MFCCLFRLLSWTNVNNLFKIKSAFNLYTFASVSHAVAAVRPFTSSIYSCTVYKFAWYLANQNAFITFSLNIRFNRKLSQWFFFLCLSLARYYSFVPFHSIRFRLVSIRFEFCHFCPFALQSHNVGIVMFINCASQINSPFMSWRFMFYVFSIQSMPFRHEHP